MDMSNSYKMLMIIIVVKIKANQISSMATGKKISIFEKFTCSRLLFVLNAVIIILIASIYFHF